MKALQKFFGIIAGVLVIGGFLFLMSQYFMNKVALTMLMNNSIVRGSLSVLQKMAAAVGVIFIGLIFLIISMKFGSIAKKNEREKRAALREQQKENDELNRQLKKEAEEARAEAEKIRKENEKLLQQTAEAEEEKAEEEPKE